MLGCLTDLYFCQQHLFLPVPVCALARMSCVVYLLVSASARCTCFVQLRNLGQQPTVSLAPRDYKAADVRIPADTAQPQQSGATSTTSNAPVDVCSQKSRQGTVQLQHKVQQQQQQQKEAQQPLQPAVGDVGSHSNLAQAGHQDNQPTAKPQLPPGQHQQDSHAGVSSGMRSVMKAELQQLKDSYLVLQDAYWAQKERLLALEVEVGQLRVQSERATAIAAEVSLGTVPPLSH